MTVPGICFPFFFFLLLFVLLLRNFWVIFFVVVQRDPRPRFDFRWVIRSVIFVEAVGVAGGVLPPKHGRLHPMERSVVAEASGDEVLGQRARDENNGDDDERPFLSQPFVFIVDCCTIVLLFF